MHLSTFELPQHPKSSFAPPKKSPRVQHRRACLCASGVQCAMDSGFNFEFVGVVGDGGPQTRSRASAQWSTQCALIRGTTPPTATSPAAAPAMALRACAALRLGLLETVLQCVLHGIPSSRPCEMMLQELCNKSCALKLLPQCFEGTLPQA